MINAINWPIQTLAVLPAVVFIILMIAFPIIGLFAGWKRGLYWGGGTLLFYLIGLLIWRFVGVAIITPFKEQLTELIRKLAQSETLVITDELLASVAAPVWFLIMMIFGELVLVINYFTWFKKVAGLKKIKVKDPKTKEVVKVYPNQTQINKGHGIINKLGGFAALGLLTIPTTAAFTQTLYCTMTSPTTRSANKATQDIHNFLVNMNDGPFGWLAYSTGTIHDYDALFSAILLLEEKITVGGKEVTVVEAVESLVENEIQGISTALENIEKGMSPEKAAEDIKGSIDAIADVWNQISDGSNAEAASALFSSPNAIDLVSQMITFEGIATIDDKTYDKLFSEENGQVTKWVEEYVKEGTISGQDINKLVPIEINEQSFDEFTNFVMGFVEFDEGAEKYQENVTNSVKDILGLLFNYPGMPESFRE